MESYVEVTFLTNIIICLFAYYASAYFSLSKCRSKYFLILLSIEQFAVSLCFNETYYLYFYLYEIFFYLFVFYHQYKKGIMYFCLKYLISFTFFKFFSGSFHLLHYFVPGNIHIYGIWLLLIFIIILLKQKWSAYLMVSDFIYDITIKADKKIVVKGFLDTGNQVSIHNIPVLFLDKRYKDLFKCNKKEEIEIKTLNKDEKLICYLCEVKINRYKERMLYICCDKSVALEWGCFCLLNLEL